MRTGYRAALRVTLRQTAAAYGYTLTIATSLSVLTTVRGTPNPGRLFLFAAGGLAAFAALEALLEIGGRSDEEAPQTAFPFAGALNFVAVGGALGASVGLAHAVESGVAWLVVPFTATAAYMLLVAAQVLAVAGLGRR